MAQHTKYKSTQVQYTRRQLIMGITAIGFGLPVMTSAKTVRPVTFQEPARKIVTSLPAIENTSAIAANALQKQPVLVTFFASWCPPCFAEFEHLNKLHSEFSTSRLQIIAINVHEEWDDNDEQRMIRFIESTHPEFPTVRGSEEIRNLFGGINRIPTVYGFDEQGNLRFNFIHAAGATKTNASYEELKAAAHQLLG